MINGSVIGNVQGMNKTTNTGKQSASKKNGTELVSGIYGNMQKGNK